MADNDFKLVGLVEDGGGGGFGGLLRRGGGFEENVSEVLDLLDGVGTRLKMYG